MILKIEIDAAGVKRERKRKFGTFEIRRTKDVGVFFTYDIRYTILRQYVIFSCLHFLNYLGLRETILKRNTLEVSKSQAHPSLGDLKAAAVSKKGKKRRKRDRKETRRQEIPTRHC